MVTKEFSEDEINKIIDRLENDAIRKCNEEVAKAQNYRNGYNQACEDMGRVLRQEIAYQKNLK